jgi:hybrid cluster-associated redox disulfide protein
MTPDIDDPNLPLAELFRAWPCSARVFWAHRTACVGCPIAPFHTLRDTCAEYRLDEAALRAALRAAAADAGAGPIRWGERGDG